MFLEGAVTMETLRYKKQHISVNLWVYRRESIPFWPIRCQDTDQVKLILCTFCASLLMYCNTDPDWCFIMDDDVDVQDAPWLWRAARSPGPRSPRSVLVLPSFSRLLLFYSRFMCSSCSPPFPSLHVFTGVNSAVIGASGLRLLLGV